MQSHMAEQIDALSKFLQYFQEMGSKLEVDTNVNPQMCCLDIKTDLLAVHYWR